MAYNLVRVINYYTNSVIIKLTDYSVFGGYFIAVGIFKAFRASCVCVCAR